MRQDEVSRWGKKTNALGFEGVHGNYSQQLKEYAYPRDSVNTSVVESMPGDEREPTPTWESSNHSSDNGGDCTVAGAAEESQSPVVYLDGVVRRVLAGEDEWKTRHDWGANDRKCLGGTIYPSLLLVYADGFSARSSRSTFDSDERIPSAIGAHSLHHPRNQSSFNPQLGQLPAVNHVVVYGERWGMISKEDGEVPKASHQFRIRPANSRDSRKWYLTELLLENLEGGRWQRFMVRCAHSMRPGRSIGYLGR